MNADKTQKYIAFGITVIASAIAVFVWFYDEGGKDANIESKMFESTEQRIEVVNHVNNSPTPTQEMYMFVLDSIEKNDRIKTRASRLKLEAYKDSMYLDRDTRNADQYYQMKQLVDSLIKKQ